MKYLGVSRAELYSPSRVSGDTAVFRAVAAELERNGHEVISIKEQDLKSIPDGVDGIFHMARSREALEVLRQAEVPVINTVQAVLNCGRAAQTRLLKGSGLIPENLICPTSVKSFDWNSFPCWIKRPDSHAIAQGDVQFIENATQLKTAVSGFAGRGIKECVLQAHVKGWLIKFYGVRGMGLADCYAATAKDGKFGLENHNDQPDSACVDMDSLTAVAERASALLGVDVYGVDAVVGCDGKITIIDFNDWPSFRTCTVGAAQKIAQLIMNKR